jgi:rhodanese-related sulfurtransferase
MSSRTQTQFRNIRAEELSSLVEGKTPPVLLDIREPFELAAYGAIPGVVNIPMEEVPDRLADLPGDRNAAIVVICQSGSRSLEVSRYLAAQGYSNVMNLAGGTYGWMVAGGTVNRPDPRRSGFL